ncbi:MOP flippase family protein [bacterium]|nr:MOP flippase family protein [bacterium]MBU1875041.1 MOP flippase family protein [bacterium]
MNLKQKAASGIKWSAVSTGAITFFQFITLAVLARILSPSDFGLMGMVMVVIGFANLFADMGISKAIIYRQDSTKSELSSLYWLNIIAGTSVFLIINSIAPLIVSFYHEERLLVLIHYSSLAFLISPFGQQFQILMQKELQFNKLSKIEIGGSFVNSIIAIILAFSGVGVLSLVYGQLFGAVFRSIILLFWGWNHWRPSFHFSKNDLKGYLGFGLYQMGEKSINYFNSNLDYLLIGSLLGAKSLGYYNLASNLVLKPSALINPILTKVAFPIFSKIQNDIEKLKRGYLKVLQILSNINFPIMIGLAITAPNIVPVIFGDKWIPSIVLVQILAFVGLLRSTGNPTGALLLAQGRADLGFKWNVGIFITQTIGLYIGARSGSMIGVAVAVLIMQIIYTLFNYIFLIRTALGNCLKEYFFSMWPALWISASMGVSVYIVGILLRSLNTFVLLTIEIVTGIIIYLVINLLYQRNFLNEMKSTLFAKA